MEIGCGAAVSDKVRIERRGALAGPKVAEVAIDALDPETRASLAAMLAQPLAAAASAPGGDRVWYRITVTGSGGIRTCDVAELPPALRALPAFGF